MISVQPESICPSFIPVNFHDTKLDVGTVVVAPVAPVEVFESGDVVVVAVFDVGVVVLELSVLGVVDVVGEAGAVVGDAGAVVGDAGVVVAVDAGLKVMAALNSRPIDSVMVSVNAAGVVVHVDVFRLMVNVVTCQSPLGALEF